MRKLTVQSENANAIVEAMRKYNFFAPDAPDDGESNIFELMGFACTYADISYIFQNAGGGITDIVCVPNSLYDGTNQSKLVDAFLETLRKNSLIPTPRIEEAPIEKFLTPLQKGRINTKDTENASPSGDLDSSLEDLFASLRKMLD